MRYKGIIHAHSTYSYDGKLSLPELKNLLQQKGVQFACMTEHTDELTKENADAFVAECRALSDDSFVFVPGFEVPYKKSHILQFGSTTFLTQFADADTLRSWSNEAVLTVLAHPVRNSFDVDEVMAEVIDGVEIWNQQYDGKRLPRVRSVALLDSLRRTNSVLIATGGVDFHRTEHLGTPYVFIETAVLSEDEILRSLKQGQFAFGSNEFSIEATESWHPSTQQKLKSAFAIAIIQTGKTTNALLAACGVSLPKSWRQALRKRL